MNPAVLVPLIQTSSVFRNRNRRGLWERNDDVVRIDEFLEFHSLREQQRRRRSSRQRRSERNSSTPCRLPRDHHQHQTDEGSYGARHHDVSLSVRGLSMNIGIPCLWPLVTKSFFHSSMSQGLTRSLRKACNFCKNKASSGRCPKMSPSSSTKKIVVSIRPQSAISWEKMKNSTKRCVHLS